MGRKGRDKLGNDNEKNRYWEGLKRGLRGNLKRKEENVRKLWKGCEWMDRIGKIERRIKDNGRKEREMGRMELSDGNEKERNNNGIDMVKNVERRRIWKDRKGMNENDELRGWRKREVSSEEGKERG